MSPKAANRSLTTGAFLRESIAQFAARLDGACADMPEIEAVHGVRVSSRRLRSLLSLFRDFLPPDAAGLRDRLRELASEFSPLRDLDVLVIHLEDWRTELSRSANAAIKPVIARLESRREATLAPALNELEAWRKSPERALLRDLEKAGSGWPTAARRRIDTVAPQLLKAAHGRFIKSLERARRRGTLDRYHKLRISGKKLRYALQALAGHYGNPAKPTIKALVAIQDGFGEYLDATNAANVLTELAIEPGWSDSTRKACATLVKRCREHARTEFEAMPGLLEKLSERRWAEMLTALTGPKRRPR